jgi:hypothetical protein
MATTIQIKRSANVAAPTTTDLLEGELAYSYDKSNNGDLAKLYIEVQDSSGNESIHTIGGKYYTSKVDAATSANTVSTIVSRDALGNFTANTITANNFVGNITASQANKLTTARYINLSGDLQGNVLFDGTQDVTIVANVINNSVALGTDTTGDYVANLTAGSGITLTNDGGESANVTVALSTSGVTANTYGGTTNIPILNIDQFGRVTSASNAAISTSFSLAANSGTTDTFNSGDTLRITGSTGINTVVSDNTISVFNTGVTSLTGSANQIAVSASNASVTLSLPDDVIVNNNLTVQGNLFIRGTATTLQTTTVSINDPLVKFGNANPSDSLDIGFFGEYVKSGNVNYAGIYRDHIDGKFRIFNDSSINPTGNIINTSDTGYSIASLVANLTGGTISGLTANIAVGDGGTGRGTFTTNGILFGNATGALKVTAAGTYGQVLQAGSDGTPVYSGIDGGVY